MNARHHNLLNAGLQRPLIAPVRVFLSKHADGGFTLLELLMVIMVVSILIGMVLGLSRRAEQVADETAARAELGDIVQALNEFYLVNQHYPSADETRSVTNVLPDIRQWTDARTDGIDPWGTPYIYEYDREQAPHTYRIFSCGADRAEGETEKEAADNVFF